MKTRLLETKFHFPPWSEGTVDRQRLTARLHSGLAEHRKLTLISAPAGYGKTTLVAGWLHNLEQGARVAWLSLDGSDNDPARFLGYWLAAFQRIDGSLGQSAYSLLDLPQLPPLPVVMDELLNDLAAQEGQVVLVLDDYHAITNPHIHEGLEYFVDHLPAQVHLVITTREDPPLPLARLRARGQMTEIRAHDLRFSQEEALRFFSQSMGLELNEDTVRTLEARTEGWAAGLQLAALALQNIADPQDFLSDFSGSHRYVIDYLLDEVLKRQPPEIREFLGKTAVLKRFNAALCQVVTGNTSAEAILARLERSNLFLVPLDDTRGWYRYHHLFADALSAGQAPEVECEIHARAAAWFEAQGLLAEAIPHWLAVLDHKQAARVIGLLAPDLLRTGQLQTLLGWLNALPDQALNTNPDLVSYKAFSLLMTGQLSLAREYAGQALQSYDGQTPGTGQGRQFAMQAWFSLTAGEQRTGELARAALDQLDGSDSFFRAQALIALGSFLAWQDDLPASNQIFEEAWMLGRQINHHFVALIALDNLVFNLLQMGRLREGEALCRAALSELVDSRGRHLPLLGIIYVPLACICFERASFDEAKDLAERGITQCQRLFSSDIMGGDSEMTLARIAFERGDPRAAFDLLQSTAETARQHGITVIIYKMAVVRTELYLLQGRLAEAELSLQDLEALALSGVTNAGQTTAFLKACFLTASGKPDQALEILDRLEQADRAIHNVRRLMKIHLTQALAYQQTGEQAEASRAMEAAVRLAAPEGFSSMFFPHPGRPTLALLESARAIAPDFVDSILSTHRPTATVEKPRLAALPEPLTEQELRVLELIVAGMSNQEIAGELYISTGTAKWHVHNILQKLGVSNRPQAIARARELGL